VDIAGFQHIKKTCANCADAELRIASQKTARPGRAVFAFGEEKDESPRRRYLLGRAASLVACVGFLFHAKKRRGEAKHLFLVSNKDVKMRDSDRALIDSSPLRLFA